MNGSIYAKPATPRIIVRPLLVTLALHGLLVYLMTMNWDFGERDTVRVKPAPKVINARLVDISELQSKPKPKPQSKPKVVAKPKPQPRVAPKPKPQPKPRPQSTPKVVEKPKPKPEPRPEPAISAAALAALAQAELDDVAAAEQSATAEELAASFAALIQQTVIGYWNRPASARNGMEALLQVQLIPTGEVVSVTLLKSSGNAAFDRSAVNAVEKAGEFPELQKLPSREFEQTFRRFRLLFRPEDLRY